jgi:hypothetical protein
MNDTRFAAEEELILAASEFDSLPRDLRRQIITLAVAARAQHLRRRQQMRTAAAALVAVGLTLWMLPGRPELKLGSRERNPPRVAATDDRRRETSPQVWFDESATVVASAEPVVMPDLEILVDNSLRQRGWLAQRLRGVL